MLSNYSWAEGETIAYRNFAPGEPNFPDEHSVYIIGPGSSIPSGQWNNRYNGTSSGYNGSPLLPVCGVVELIPEPSKAALVALVGSALVGACHRARRQVS